MAKEYNYCPKCGYKKLKRVYDYSHRHYVWKCEHGHNQGYGYRRRRYNQSSDKKPKKKPVPCDCVIKAEGRDAEIADFGTALDQINRGLDPEIYRWLLENESTVQRRGLKVLHEAETFDVVRCRFASEPPGVYLFFKHCWKKGNHYIEGHNDLTSRAAEHVHFRGISVRDLFWRGDRVLVWSQDPSCYYRDKPPFDGNLGKKKTAAAIEWATALVEELPQLVETATAENKRWHQEQVALVRSVSGFGIEVSNYDGHLKKASIHIRQFLTPEQVQAIAEIVGRNDE